MISDLYAIDTTNRVLEIIEANEDMTISIKTFEKIKQLLLDCLLVQRKTCANVAQEIWNDSAEVSMTNMAQKVREATVEDE